MNLGRREFLQVLGAAAVAGMALGRHAQADAAQAEAALYDLPPLGSGPGFVSFLHMTDCHAQLMPIHFREPSVNLGAGSMRGQMPHLVSTCCGRPALRRARGWRMPTPSSTSSRRPGATARSAASRTWPRS